MVQFLDTWVHTGRDLALEFLSTLNIKVASGSQCQEGYISFYLNREKFYELNLIACNDMFSFLPSLDLRYHRLPKNFNRNAF